MARYAYLLSRMEPGRNDPNYGKYKDFAGKMYNWGISPKDRDELMIAMQIYVYERRGEQEETEGT